MAEGTYSGFVYPEGCSAEERERIDHDAQQRALPDERPGLILSPMRNCKVCRKPFRTYDDPMHEKVVTCPACLSGETAMTETTDITTPDPPADIMERVVIDGDLSKLTTEQRLIYYNQMCQSLGLNPLTKPFQYLRLSGKLTLYATKDCTEQLRKKHGVSITDLTTTEISGLHVVVAKARDKDGRTDCATGAVPIGRLTGDNLANAVMKAETKSKRRVTLSICGLGMLDESELETVAGAEVVSDPAALPEPTVTSKPSPPPNQTTREGSREPEPASDGAVELCPDCDVGLELERKRDGKWFCRSRRPEGIKGCGGEWTQEELNERRHALADMDGMLNKDKP